MRVACGLQASPPHHLWPLASCTSHSLSASSAFPRSLTVMAMDSYWLAVTRQSAEGESEGFSTPGAASEASHHCPTLKPGTALLPISPFLKGISLRPGESSSLPQGLTWRHRHIAQQQVWPLSTFYSICCGKGCPGAHYAARACLENMMLLLYPPECWELPICLKSWVSKLEHTLAQLGGLLRHKLGSSLLYFRLAGPGESWRIWFQPMNRCGWYEVTVDAQWSCKTLGREGAYARATHGFDKQGLNKLLSIS